jgi:hypothetical protein
LLKPVTLVVRKRIKCKNLIKTIVTVLSVKVNLRVFLRNILEDFKETVIPRRNFSLSAGHITLKLSSLPALSVKSLATGHLSVLCGLKLESKQR